MGVPFPSGLRLVVEDVEVAVADLKKIDVAGDGVAIKREIESAAPVVREIVACEVDRDFDCNGHGIVDEHEALQRLMTLLVRRRRGKHEISEPGRVIFFSRDRGMEGRGKL